MPGTDPLRAPHAESRPRDAAAPLSLAALPAAFLKGELARIVRSGAFAPSARHRRFLEYLVENALRADGVRLKEMTLGIEVFDRPASHFDPQHDTIVRVEARRLRARLARYYREDGADSLIEIVLPVGSYLPVIQRRPQADGLSSLAILPVVDRSGTDAGPAFCDDVLDALIDAAARVPGLKVIARKSALRAVAADMPDDRALAELLGVSLLLRGTLDRDDSAVRLKLTVADGEGGERGWTGSWTFAVTSDFRTRDALVVRIVEDVQRGLATRRADHPAPAEPSEPIDERARDLVDRGQYMMRYGTVDTYPHALERFRAAALLAPRYPAAHFGIARSLSYLLGMTQIAPSDGVDEARRAALEALALNPRHGDAASLVAAIQQRFDHDWPAAQAGYLAAIALTPGSVYVHLNYAFGLMFSGRFAEADIELRLARELDPLDIGQRATVALLHLYRRDLDGAEAIIATLIEDQPRHLLAHSLRGALLLFRGAFDEGAAAYRVARDLAPDISIGVCGIAQAHALAGRFGEARAERAALVDAFGDRYLSPYQLALIDLRLGRFDDAFAALERSAAERDPNFIAVLVDPTLDPLREDPRFAALLQRHGLADVLPATVSD